MTDVFRTVPSHPVASRLGLSLAAIPLLIGAGGAVLALGGRFGGRDNAFTAFWYMAAAAVPFALVGAALLVWSTGFDRKVIAAAAVSLGGWAFGMASARVSGLATSPEEEAQTWQYVLLGAGIATYLIGLVALLVVASKAEHRAS